MMFWRTFIHSIYFHTTINYLVTSILQNMVCVQLKRGTHTGLFGTTWGWVKDDKMFIFGWTIPLSHYIKSWELFRMIQFWNPVDSNQRKYYTVCNWRVSNDRLWGTDIFKLALLLIIFKLDSVSRLLKDIFCRPFGSLVTAFKGCPGLQKQNLLIPFSGCVPE